MKRIYAALGAIMMGVSMFTGCQTAGNPAAVTKEASDTAGTASAEKVKNGDSAAAGADSTAEKEKISVVTTIFPEYDWVREIVGGEADRYDLTMLLDNGVDLHSYQPTADDISKISKCDLFIYAGGESDEWVKDALKQAENKDMKVINMMEMLGDSVKTEEVVEGMESEHDHDHDEDGEHHDSDQEVEYDEHTWLSLKNAEMICEAIENDLSSLDPENKDIYKNNTAPFPSHRRKNPDSPA